MIFMIHIVKSDLPRPYHFNIQVHYFLIQNI